MAITSKLPTTFDATVDASGKLTTKPTVTAKIPARTEQFSGVEDPVKLAQTLTRLQAAINEVTQQARSNSRSNAQIFKNIKVKNSGYVFSVTHNLKRAVQWNIVRWCQGSAGASIVEDDANTTSNKLVLISYVTGIVDLEIF